MYCYETLPSKSKRILTNVLEAYVQNQCVKDMKTICTFMIDFSRDVSNKNQLIIAATIYESEKNKIKRVVFEILEQNNTN